MNRQYLSPLFLVILAILIVSFLVLVKNISADSEGSVVLTVQISVCGNEAKEGGEHCDNDDLSNRSCSDLGYSGGSLSCTAACEFNTANCTTSANNTAIPLFTSNLGGEYTITDDDNSASIDLIENFYSQDLRLQMFSYDQTDFEEVKTAPSGKNYIGKVYDLVFIDPNGNNVSEISEPATLTLTYTDADISGYNESTLAPYHWGDNDSSWELISGATVDTANNQVTFSTNSFSSFALFGSATPVTSPSNPSSGGGGGGTYILVTAVNFIGRAYPKSTVTLLKDAQVAATTITGSDATFSVNVSSLSGGNYIFSVYSEDTKGARSSMLTFPISLTSGATTNVSGIFIAPTIAVDKSEVKRGDNIAIFGQSVPSSEITITINSEEEIFNKVKTDSAGTYLYNFDTSLVENGQHLTKAKAAYQGEISSFSKVISFNVGTQNVSAKPTTAAKGDLNNDNRVNLIDFSISAYWYKRSNPPVSIDLNSDKKVDLVDFSIMAYYWTG